ncbi:ubiquitin-protein ligase E3A-like [Artemia franciscana]|uniref:HECT-type E3 ubiquitin transferase n=1 Tax=Artemia franciscana TaxID=6661 RepID=A0AA88HWX8_ARTSF|nr:hypothetical protein QYM36_010305 [Artemia franciscana]KAK2715686.1 hypothetical protein QYM36_010305 [Artemia franciscana]
MEIDEEKKAAARKLIQKYYYQLTVGCGNIQCENEHCASSGKVPKLSANQAAAQGLVLFTRKAKLCNIDPSEAALTYAMDHDIDGPLTGKKGKSGVTHSIFSSPARPLTESYMQELVGTCKETERYSPLIRILGMVYSDPILLANSFTLSIESNVQSIKEEMRSMETEKDEDTISIASSYPDCDSMEADHQRKYEVTVDLESLRRAYQCLMQVDPDIFEGALIHGIRSLSDNLVVDLQLTAGAPETTNVLNIIVILCDLPVIGQGEYLERAVPAIAKVVGLLCPTAAASLVRFFANQSPQYLRNLVQTLQQLISLRVLSGNFSESILPNDDKEIVACTKMLKLLYFANVLDNCPTATVEDHEDWYVFSRAARSSERQVPPPENLGKELGISVNLCRKGKIPLSEFYNEPLSDIVEMDKEFSYFLSISNGPSYEKFSFLRHGFILTTATKVLGLYFDSRIRMASEQRLSYIASMMAGQPTTPYCIFQVRRDHIVDDALANVEMIANERPDDLKKQLVVDFEGEQGVDEGGLSKEFFQLLIEQLFNPDFAMFIWRSESRTHWFNPTAFENDANFTLVGILFGLAIYNTVILDVRFPSVVYRKLLDAKGTFEDLEDFDPVLFRTLSEMLEYPGDDFDDIYMMTFRVAYTDIFGSTLFHDLKPNGDEVPVTKDNKKEFVDLYADFLLNGSIATQFKAFAKGFKLIASESPLSQFFRPDELEELVCGSPEFDFTALESSAEYDNGYTRNSDVIKNFWSVLHSLDDEGKRQFLQFTTGSDRVPVGGMSKLKLMIARNGPDTDRLPTAHTCFNVLLLPEYVSKEKLRDRLLKAISYAKGFGLQ